MGLEAVHVAFQEGWPPCPSWCDKKHAWGKREKHVASVSWRGGQSLPPPLSSSPICPSPGPLRSGHCSLNQCGLLPTPAALGHRYTQKSIYTTGGNHPPRPLQMVHVSACVQPAQACWGAPGLLTPKPWEIIATKRYGWKRSQKSSKSILQFQVG